MLNRTVLVGRLIKDPDLRYTPEGTAVANFTIAVNRPFTNQQGNRDADFINCVVWRKPAENLANYMKKGNQIGVDGRIQTRNYENNEGQRVYVTEVVADSVQFLETKSSNQSNNQSQVNAYNQEVGVGQSDPFQDDGQPIDITDDMLPF